MCFKTDKSAARAADRAYEQQQKYYEEQKAESERVKKEQDEREEKRQKTIKDGQDAISNAFAGFDDNYYKKLSDTYTNNLLPQIEDQRKSALDTLTADLTDRGIRKSTVGNAAIAKIDERSGEAKTNVGNDATSYANKIKGQVEQQKNSLLDLNQSSTDSSAMANRAQGDSATLSQNSGGSMPSTISNVFTDLVTPWAYAYAANQGSRNPYSTRNFFSRNGNSVSYG